MTPIAIPFNPVGISSDTSGRFYNSINPTGISSNHNGSSFYKPTGISFGPTFDPARFSSETFVVPSETTTISSSHNGVFPSPDEVSSSTVVSSGSARLPSTIDKVSSSSRSSGNTGNPEVETEIQNLAKGKLTEELEGEGQNTDKIQASNDLLSSSKDTSDKNFATRRLRKIQPKPPHDRERWATKATASQPMKVSEQQVKEHQHQHPEVFVQGSENENKNNIDHLRLPAIQKLGAFEDNPPGFDKKNLRLPTIQELGVFDDGPPLFRPIATYPISMKARQELFENTQFSQIRDSRDTAPSNYATNESQSNVWTKVPRPTSPLPSKTSLSTTSSSTSSQITSTPQVGTATSLPESSFSKSNVTSTGSSGRMFTTSTKPKTTESTLQRGTITLPPLVPTVSYPDYSKPAKVSSELHFSKAKKVIPPLQSGLNASLNQSIIPSMQTPNESINFKDDFITSVKPNEYITACDESLCTEKDASVVIAHDLTQESTLTEKLATEQGSSKSARKSSPKILNTKIPSSVSISKSTIPSSESDSESDHLPMQITVEEEIEEDIDELMADIPEEVISIRDRKKRYREQKNEFSTVISSTYSIKRAKKEKREKEKRERTNDEEEVAPRRARPINDRAYLKPTRRITRNAAREKMNPCPKEKSQWVRRAQDGFSALQPLQPPIKKKRI
ncbi:17563_t:CDS:2 [Funneliformis geosporum]|nr:17563_t:CDS:2 [Funneliformis geosporum]